MRILIVDDEPLARRRLVRLVEQLGEDEIAGEADDGVAALEAIARLAPDVVLLDISMPGLDGLAVAAADHAVPVIFTTAHPEHAVAAFEVEAVDYLLKPIALERLEAALARARRHQPTIRLSARCHDSTRVFEANCVARYTARDKYTTCHLDGEELVLDESLNTLEARLSKLGYVRVHRAELIDLACVVRTHSEGGRLTLELDDGATVAVSRRATAEVRRRLRDHRDARGDCTTTRPREPRYPRGSMKRLVVLALLLSPLPAYAEAPTDDFCAQPTKSICNFPFVTSTGRDLLAKIDADGLRKRVLADFAKRIGRDPKTFDERALRAIPGLEGTSLRFDYAIALYQAHAKERRDAEWRVVTANFERIKGLMVQAIRARVARTPRLVSPIRGAALEKALNDIILLDMDGVFALAAKEPKFHADAVAKDFVETCGVNGMEINAFASRFGDVNNPVRRYLIICPGLIMSSFGRDQTGWNALPGVLSTVLHELAHHIDHHGFPEIYDRYESCALEHHVNRLRPIPDQTKLPTWSRITEPQRRAMIVANHMAEISADLWAIEAFAIHLARFPPENRLTQIRMSFGALCGTRDEGLHPPGDFRLELLLRGDPRITKLMGCPAKHKVATTCSMDGANVGSLATP